MGWRGRAAAAAVAITALGLATGCSFGGGSGTGLTIYNAQHEDLVKAMIQGFVSDTGINVTLRNGSDFELGNQLLEEGSASPADVFLTENSPAMSLVSGKELFAPLDAGTVAQVPAQWVAGGKDWLGFAARSTVLAYNRTLQPAAGLPKSIMELAGPAWKGGVGIAAAGADFQAIVSAVVAVKGQAAAAAWLKGLKANAKIYRSNVAVMAAVDSGEVRTGIMYHYYWYKDRAEGGTNSRNVELEFFGNKDPGAFVSVSGAGVLRSSKHAADAQKLVAYLTGKQGQEALANSDALEYPVGTGIAPDARLRPLSQLDPPSVDIGRLNGPNVVTLMQQAGLL